MTSHPAASCCFQGVRHEGDVKGSLSTLADFEVYVSTPPSVATTTTTATKYGIALIPDILGHRFINAQLIADQFAANGYHVIMPDIFYGDALTPTPRPGFDMMKWINGADHPKKIPHTPEIIDPIVQKCIQELRESYQCQKVAGVGYCIGAKYIIRHLHPAAAAAAPAAPASHFDVGFIAHPSFVSKDELRLIANPLAIAASDTDRIFPLEKRRETEDILFELGIPYQLNLYSGVEHGFALKGDLSIPAMKYGKESAFITALQWFAEYLR